MSTEMTSIEVHHIDDMPASTNNADSPDLCSRQLNQDFYHYIVVSMDRTIRKENAKTQFIFLCLRGLFVFLFQFIGLLCLVFAYEIEQKDSPGQEKQITPMDPAEYLDIYPVTIGEYLPNNKTYFAIIQDWSEDDSGWMSSTYAASCNFFSGLMGLLILSAYLMQSASSWIFLFTVSMHDTDKCNHIQIKRFIKVITILNMILVYISWFLASRFIFYYSTFINPTSIILTPVGIVFVLEVDDWIIKIFHVTDEDLNTDPNFWKVKIPRHAIEKYKWMLGIFYSSIIPHPIIYILTVFYVDGAGPFYRQPDNDTFFIGEYAYIGYGTIIVVYALGYTAYRYKTSRICILFTKCWYYFAFACFLSSAAFIIVEMSAYGIQLLNS